MQLGILLTALRMHAPHVLCKECFLLDYQLSAPFILAYCSPFDDALRQSSAQLPAEAHQMQPQLPQPTRQAQADAPLQANAQPVPETKRKLL